MNDHRAQDEAGVRFEWGPTGCIELSAAGGCVAVVDVLTFTTSLAVATARGIAVLPLPLDADDPEDFATARRAELAVPRAEVSSEHPWCLSPASLSGGPWTDRLVLPSPNGALVSLVAEGTVVAACLRNAQAVASWIIDSGFGNPDRPVLVVASGERWPDSSLRPALEDALGAGAVLAGLAAAGLPLSAEAKATAAMYQHVGDLAATVRNCASARELQARGYAHDVEAAVELDVDAVVPLLSDGAFSAA